MPPENFRALRTSFLVTSLSLFLHLFFHFRSLQGCLNLVSFSENRDVSNWKTCKNASFFFFFFSLCVSFTRAQCRSVTLWWKLGGQKGGYITFHTGEWAPCRACDCVRVRVGDPSSGNAQGRTHTLTLIWTARLAEHPERRKQTRVHCVQWKQRKLHFHVRGKTDLWHEDGMSVPQIGSVIVGGESCLHDTFQL